jgi:hypothetical protein
VSARRLETGGVVDRSDTRHFTWDGKRMTGLAGDSLASALMANGERILGRGFKYHRPRGVMSAGVEEGGAIVTVGTGARRTPNVKATAVELVDGLEAFGQNAWPSVRFDVGRVNDLLGRFFGAGFYYKTFMGVTGSGTWEWMQFEKLIRQAAGMGEAVARARSGLVRDGPRLLRRSGRRLGPRRAGRGGSGGGGRLRRCAGRTGFRAGRRPAGRRRPGGRGGRRRLARGAALGAQGLGQGAAAAADHRLRAL